MIHLLNVWLGIISAPTAIAGCVKIWLPRLFWSEDLHVLHLLWRYTRWLVPISMFFTAMDDHYLPGKIFWFIVTAVWVGICLDDDDDWWRKQARKATGKVRDLGHRLVIDVGPQVRPA